MFSKFFARSVSSKVSSFPLICQQCKKLQQIQALGSASYGSFSQDQTKRNSNLWIGFGALSFLGFSFLKYYNRENFMKASTMFPTVKAATPLGKIPIYPKAEDEPNIKKPTSRKNFNFIADAVEEVIDSIVYIGIESQRSHSAHWFGEMQGQNHRNGSGFVIKEDGLILTNAHVVSDIPRSSVIMVHLPNGEKYKGVVEEFDSFSDLALIRIDCKNLKPVKVGVSKDCRAGEFVIAIGSPLSLANTITSGVISSVSRSADTLGVNRGEIDYIQTDAAITFGNSGGPLINLDGEVIGINSLSIKSGISFAIPSDNFKTFLERAEKKKKFLEMHPQQAVKRRFLGITMLSLNSAAVNQLRNSSSSLINIPHELRKGVIVWRVVTNSPAYSAGLSPGDIITHINGKEISSARDVYTLLDRPGDLKMVVLRDGQRYSVTVAPEE